MIVIHNIMSPQDRYIRQQVWDINSVTEIYPKQWARSLKTGILNIF